MHCHAQDVMYPQLCCPVCASCTVMPRMSCIHYCVVRSVPHALLCPRCHVSICASCTAMPRMSFIHCCVVESLYYFWASFLFRSCKISVFFKTMTQSLSCHKKDADACSHKHSEGNLPYSNIVNEKMLLFIFSICILVKILLFVTSSILIYHANVVCRTFEENALLHNKVRQNTLTLSCYLHRW